MVFHLLLRGTSPFCQAACAASPASPASHRTACLPGNGILGPFQWGNHMENMAKYMENIAKYGENIANIWKDMGNNMGTWWSFDDNLIMRNWLGYAGIFDDVDVQNAQNKPHLLPLMQETDALGRWSHSALQYMVAGLFASHYAGIWWNIVRIMVNHG